MLKHTVERLYSCEVVNLAFSLASHLSHMQPHTAGEHLYKLCSAFVHGIRLNTHRWETISMLSMWFHIFTVHLFKITHSEEKIFSCEVCGLVFYEILSLESHIQLYWRLFSNLMIELLKYLHEFSNNINYV